MIDNVPITKSTLRWIIQESLKDYETKVLLHIIKDDDYIARTLIARELHARPSVEVFEGAVELCRSEKEEYREIGAYILGQLGAPERFYVDESLDILSGLLSDHHLDVMIATIEAIGHLGSLEYPIQDDNIMTNILKYADHSNASARKAVAFSLGTMKYSDRLEQALRILESDRDQEVKEWAEVSRDLIENRR